PEVEPAFAPARAPAARLREDSFGQRVDEIAALQFRDEARGWNRMAVEAPARERLDAGDEAAADRHLRLEPCFEGITGQRFRQQALVDVQLRGFVSQQVGGEIQVDDVAEL